MHEQEVVMGRQKHAGPVSTGPGDYRPNTSR
jgi:hypothetical protein